MRIRVRYAVTAITLALALPGSVFGSAAGTAPNGKPDATAAAPDSTDATTLYNAGTVALERGALGPSVTLLLAAARLEPRAPDIHANLASAFAAAAREAGEEGHPDDSSGWPVPLSADEAWWVTSAVLALGAALGLVGAFRGLPRSMRWIGTGLMIAGIAASAALYYAAWDESKHPEAVVVASTVSVERGPEEPSRPAVLLSAGERVRLGVERGGRVEIRLGSVRIGWASREGLWRVADAPRYTSSFRPR